MSLPEFESGRARQVVLVGSYVPRRCGLATFGHDLWSELSRQFPATTFAVAAVQDGPESENYPTEVDWVVRNDDPCSYLRLAADLNRLGVDCVSLQHEYGIFGGQDGEHVLGLVRNLQAPLVTTLHTILRDPSPNQRRILDEVLGCSSRVVVMSRKGVDILRDVHGVPESQIEHIHHGVPEFPSAKDLCLAGQLGLTEKQVLMTFGLISPGKGLETAIRAMPEILDRCPEAVYYIVGATHPKVVSNYGESYRESLVDLATELGVQDQVLFHNAYLSLAELGAFLSLADVYVTPYPKVEQITSGTLAYAVGSGRAIISTPYWHAQELLAHGCGVLVPFADPRAIAQAATRILTDHPYRADLQAKTRRFGREMSWPNVADRFMDMISESVSGKEQYQSAGLEPSVNLSHLRLLTHDAGLVQHAKYNVPNFSEGFCVDDNARALVLAVTLDRTGRDMFRETSGYLAFVTHAFNEDTGRFRNFMSFENRWLEEEGSGDSQGRALWGLGAASAWAGDPSHRSLAEEVLIKALPIAGSLTYLRSKAFALLGLCAYERTGKVDRVREHITTMAEALLEAYRSTAVEDWRWFEAFLSYDNARLPQALLASARLLKRTDMMEAGLTALDWLADVQTAPQGWFEPVGSDYIFAMGGERALFDQQPVEAWASVSAYLEAYQVTGVAKWSALAQQANAWFLGSNRVGLALANPRNGSCRDGLSPGGANANCGAESTLAYLTAAAELQLSGIDSRTSANSRAYVS